MALSGYPLEDLLFKSSLYRQVETALQIQHAADTIAVVIGHPSQKDHKRYNSASVFTNSKALPLHKQCLPNNRSLMKNATFAPAQTWCFDFKGVRWHPYL